MQVSNVTGQSSSATLGARAAKAVSMTQNSSLMMMLTSNLYSNQLLAAIREPLCNAWDAHIEAGTTDTPIRIKITSDYNLVIEDSGLGIPDDKIEDIYGIYGESTKANNNMVTGGFGLGSKAPWAYADSFRVISEHAGIKTVYNLPKSCVENNGDPGIIPVLSVPTERSGLTVIIPIKEDDMEEIEEYIRAIVKHGSMNATLEIEDQEPETKLNVIDLDATPGSYSVKQEDWHYDYMGNHKVFIRYGAVIYPMLVTPTTKKAYDLLIEFMELVGFRRMVVQAAPGSLVLTPSREALSSQKMTENGLTDLCVSLVKRIEEDLIASIPEAMKEAIATLESGIYPNADRYCRVDHMFDPLDVIKPYSLRAYLNSSLGSGFYRKYFNQLKAAEYRGFCKTHTFDEPAATRQYHKMRKHFVRTRRSNYQSTLFGFFKRFVLRPLGKVIASHDFMDKSALRLAVTDYWAEYRVVNKYFWEEIGFDHWEQHKSVIDNKTIFIAPRMLNLGKTIGLCPQLPRKNAAWVYKIDAKTKNKDAIVKAFSDAGFTVIDLTLNHSWDTPNKEYLAQQARKQSKVAAKKDSKPAKNMLASLCNFYMPNGDCIGMASTAKLVADPQYVTDSPLFYIESDGYRDNAVGRYANYVDLTEEERMRGVLVRNGIERRMAETRGAVAADDYFGPKLAEVVLSNRYKQYVTKLRQKSLPDVGITSQDIKLLKELNIPLTGLDKLKFDPYLERVFELFVYGYPHHLIEMMKKFDPTGVKSDALTSALDYKFELPKFGEKIRILNKDPMLHTLSINSHRQGLHYWLRVYPERKAALRSLVLSALKNGNKS